jgi:hypothetical protein
MLKESALQKMDVGGKNIGKKCMKFGKLYATLYE